MMLVCQNGADSAAVTALTILARMDADNRLYGPEEQLNVVFVMDQTEVYFGICGDEERYIPAVIAPEFEQLLSNGKFLRSMEPSAHYGKQPMSEWQTKIPMQAVILDVWKTPALVTGLYVFMTTEAEKRPAGKTDASTPLTRPWNSTEKGFYYEAKNLLACVLRENPKDMAAKYYIFRCEDLQKKN